MMSNEATAAAKLSSKAPTLSLPIEEHPELIFGLVGPI
jgi:hypothetical protein